MISSKIFAQAPKVPDLALKTAPKKKLLKKDKLSFFSFISENNNVKKLMDISLSEKTSPEAIHQKIKEAYNSIKSSKPSKQAIIFLGNTDAGKSTLCNYIAGIPLKAINIRVHGLVIELLNENILEAYSKIGHHTVSQTTNPIELRDEDGNSIWDAPGFGDSRGANVDIPNCYMIKTLFQNTEKCKIVFVVDQDTVKDQNRSQTFIKRINNIIELFSDVSKIEKSVFLAVTKVSKVGFEKDSDLCEFIGDMIQEHPEFNETQRKVLKLFMEEQRVILFHKPEREGIIPSSDRDIYSLRTPYEPPTAKFNSFPSQKLEKLT